MPEKQPNPFRESRIRKAILSALLGTSLESLKRIERRLQNWRHHQDGISKENVQRGTLRHRQSTKRTTHSSSRKGSNGTASDDGDGRRQRRKNEQKPQFDSKVVLFLRRTVRIIFIIFCRLKNLKDALETIQFYWSYLKPCLKWILGHFDIQ